MYEDTSVCTLYDWHLAAVVFLGLKGLSLIFGELYQYLHLEKQSIKLYVSG
jgi:hypothetical protein